MGYKKYLVKLGYKINTSEGNGEKGDFIILSLKEFKADNYLTIDDEYVDHHNGDEIYELSPALKILFGGNNEI